MEGEAKLSPILSGLVNRFVTIEFHTFFGFL